MAQTPTFERFWSVFLRFSKENKCTVFEEFTPPPPCSKIVTCYLKLLYVGLCYKEYRFSSKLYFGDVLAYSLNLIGKWEYWFRLNFLSVIYRHLRRLRLMKTAVQLFNNMFCSLLKTMIWCGLTKLCSGEQNTVSDEAFILTFCKKYFLRPYLNYHTHITHKM